MYASTRLIILHIPRERLIYVHGLNTGERKRRELHLGLSAGQGQLEWATTGRVVAAPAETDRPTFRQINCAQKTMFTYDRPAPN